MADVTVTLAKGAKRAAIVRNANRVYTVEPGGEATVPERIARHLARQGAKVKGGEPKDDQAPTGAGS